MLDIDLIQRGLVAVCILAAVVTLFVWQLNQPGPIVLEGCTEVHRPGTVAVSPRNLPKPRDTVLVRTR